MMKLLCVLLFASICSLASTKSEYRCTIGSANITKKWIDMDSACIKNLTAQIKMEVEASLTYLAMAAHFARDSQNRPGFSKFFFENASEEREHAIKIIEYLLMRGQLVNGINDILEFPLIKMSPVQEEWATGLDALNHALTLESNVTRSIRSIILACENPSNINANDYHLVDYLSGEFLEEQYKGERDLAGKISTLGRMIVNNGPLGEFLFDKKLLNGEV
ncbi:ferritin subunit [Polistes fuscatus]|uniref:ferritin subunit n=1 Tax=Polistes fuscatus TaxID=30207 RepID=UPI001CAA410E|nr:ferritin subunit [Polistes fuscatus]